MNVDWAADVKKHVPDADDGVIAAIIRHCGIALQNRDSSLVSFNDPAETGRVRESFLKRKLGLTLPDEVLDAGIAQVGQRMAGVSFRTRVTVYYLLAEHFAKLHLFGQAGPADQAAGGASGLVAGAGAAVAGTAALAGQAAGSVVDGATDAAQGAADRLSSAASSAGQTLAGTAAAVAGGASDLAGKAAGTVADLGGAAGQAVAGAGAAAAGAVGGVTGAVGAGLNRAQSVFENAGEPQARRKWGWLLWVLLALLALAILLWLFGCQARTGSGTGPAASGAGAAVDASLPSGAAVPPQAEPSAAAVPAPAAITAPSPAAGPAANTSDVSASLASRVTSETRDGKPLVKIFFRPGSAWVVPAFDPAAQTLKTYLADHPGATLAVSGFADKTGNAAVNAAISKERAGRVKAALVAAGIAEGAIALVKPAEAIDSADTSGAGRRVEVSVQ